MALITADRVKEITRTTGTGSFSLEGTSTGYRAFENVCANNDTCYYCVVSQSGSEWEIGLGTFKTVNTLERTTVHSSSNAGALVNFSAGTKDIFLAITASQFTGSTLPSQTGNSGKFLTTNGATASWSDNPLGTVTSVNGTGTVNGITLTGNVTTSGNLTLGGTLSGVNLGTQVTGTLSVSNGGTGTTTGSITGTGALTFTAGGSNQGVTVSPSGTGTVKINNTEFVTSSYPYGSYSIIRTVQRSDDGEGGQLAIAGPAAKTSGAGGNVSISPGAAAGGGARGWVTVDGVTISNNNNGLTVAIGSTAITGQGSVAVGYRAGGANNPSSVTGRNVFLGYESGYYANSPSTPQTSVVDSVCLGYRAYPDGNADSNTIVIGCFAVGEGSNTTVIGNTSTTSTRLHGYTKTKSLQETVFAITDGSSVDINPANGGIQVWTLGANRTPTASSFAEGQSVTLMIDDGTSYAVTWSTINPTWIGGSAPTLATSGYTVIELWKRSSTIYGALVGTA